MKELVEVIAKSLVDYPDEVAVTETEEDNAVLVELKVAPADMGKGHRPSGKNCQGNPYRSESCIFQKRQKSSRRYFTITVPTAFLECVCQHTLGIFSVQARNTADDIRPV